MQIISMKKVPDFKESPGSTTAEQSLKRKREDSNMDQSESLPASKPASDEQEKQVLALLKTDCD